MTIEQTHNFGGGTVRRHLSVVARDNDIEWLVRCHHIHPPRGPEIDFASSQQ